MTCLSSRETISNMRQIALCIIAIGCGSEHAKPQPTANEAALARAKAGPYLNVHPIEMLVAYASNSVTADSTYRDKVLRVRGIVDHVGQSDGVPVIVLRDYQNKAADTIGCVWGDERKLAEKYMPGATVVLAGVGAGQALGRPVLIGCTDLHMTAVEISDAFDAKPPDVETFWKRNLETFLEGKEIKKYDVTYNDTSVVITTSECDRARLAVEQLGPMPEKYTVECVAPTKGDASTSQWRLPEK